MKKLLPIILIMAFWTNSVKSQRATLVFKDSSKVTGVINRYGKFYIDFVRDGQKDEYAYPKGDIAYVINDPVKVNSSDTSFIYTGVVNIDSSVTADQVFDRAKRWLADAFISSKAVLEIADKANGEIVGNGNFKVVFVFMGGWSTGEGIVEFKVKIWAKDHRYKYEFSKFTHKSNNINYPDYGLVTNSEESPDVMWPMAGRAIKNRYWHDLQTDTRENANRLVENLKNYMAKPTENIGW